MATPKSQRVGIWIIALIMILGTLGSFLAMTLSIQNESIDQAQQEKAYQEYLDQQKAAALLNEPIDGYSSRTFDVANVKELKVEVLKEGTGAEVKATDSINSSYFGWLADGSIFDSSKKKAEEDKPITFPLSGVISGWTEGITGQKEGSIIRLTIPADKAYGAQGSGLIPANSPLEFIVEIHKIDNTEV